MVLSLSQTLVSVGISPTGSLLDSFHLFSSFFLTPQRCCWNRRHGIPGSGFPASSSVDTHPGSAFSRSTCLDDAHSPQFSTIGPLPVFISQEFAGLQTFEKDQNEMEKEKQFPYTPATHFYNALQTPLL